MVVHNAIGDRIGCGVFGLVTCLVADVKAIGHMYDESCGEACQAQALSTLSYRCQRCIAVNNGPDACQPSTGISISFATPAHTLVDKIASLTSPLACRRPDVQ